MMNEVNYADQEDDDDSVEIPNTYDYQLHLNNYLPTYHLGSDPDTDEATPMLGRHALIRPQQTSSPDAPRYASLALPHHAGAGSYHPKKSVLPARGVVLAAPRTSGEEDQVCDIEDAEDESSAFKRTPSPRVTQV